MSEDVKKNLRTQGKYSDKVLSKTRDSKRPKDSPPNKEHPEKKSQKKGPNETDLNLLSDLDVSPVKYEENTRYSFDKLEDAKKPIEIRDACEIIISETANGISSVLYEPHFISLDEGNEIYDELYEKTDWYDKNIVIRGQEFPQPRLVAWYGPFPYSYSGVILEPAEMPEVVLQIKNRVEDYLKSKSIDVTLNSVLLNLYRSGHDSVAWHSDDELTMGICPTIASVSLGETRRFEMKRNVQSYPEEIDEKNIDRYFANLVHGSLIVMNGVMQTDWQHRVPKEYHEKDARINLTFRTVYSLDKCPLETSEKEHKLVGNSSTVKHFEDKVSFSTDEFPTLVTTIKSPPDIEPVYFNTDEFPTLVTTIKSPPDTEPVYFSTDEFPTLSTTIKSPPDTEPEVSQDASLASDSSMQAFEDTDKSSMEYFDAISEFPVQQAVQMVNPQSNVEVPDKCIDADNLFADEDMNVDDSTDKTVIFDKNVETVFSVDTPMTNIHSGKNSSFSALNSSNLNVDAQEFVPSSFGSYHNNYETMELLELSKVKTKNLSDEEFFKFMDILIKKCNELKHEFSKYETEELDFILNLIKISPCPIAKRFSGERICIIVQRSYERDLRPKPYYQRMDYHGGNQWGSNNSNRGKRYSYKDDIPRYNARREKNTSDGFSNRSEGNSSRPDDQVKRGKTMSYRGARQANREKASSSHGSENKEKSSNKDENSA